MALQTPASPLARPDRIAVRRRAGRAIRRSARFATLLAAATTFPFLVLTGGSLYAYRNYPLHAWLATAVGAALTCLLLVVYANWLWHRLTGASRAPRRAARVASSIVVVYCAYATLYLSGMNAKTEEIRRHYTSLHPVLRLAVSTVILADGDAVITDLGRVPDDYPRMGLPVNPRSRHYRQPDGYVHAVDLRTLDRWEIRNLLLEGYFRLLGFRTLRHVGTEDHLHVAMPPRSR